MNVEIVLWVKDRADGTLDLLGLRVGILVATGDYGACYSKHTEHGRSRDGTEVNGQIENQRMNRTGETDAWTCVRMIK